MKLPKELREKEELRTSGGSSKYCSVIKCRKEAVRSLSENTWKDYVEKAKLKYKENRFKKIYLCKKHYKAAKKIRQKDNKYNQKKGFLDDSLNSGRVR
ncbi:MAG: hypothetical protein GF317_14260 [Candidatus Lokiarchaeota archaeon]|nr:hypothetical protein [Candidatus Lokiarchaeota archaeon]MBD3200780.1 hypothetical protein [Candidatus Lokiarchaeota archaeon]